MGSEIETLKKEYRLQSERVGVLLFFRCYFSLLYSRNNKRRKKILGLHQEAELLRTKFEYEKRRSQDGSSDNTGKD